MSLTFRAALCLLALSLSLINPAFARRNRFPNPPASSEVNNLAVALAGAQSEEEQSRGCCPERKKS